MGNFISRSLCLGSELSEISPIILHPIRSIRVVCEWHLRHLFNFISLIINSSQFAKDLVTEQFNFAKAPSIDVDAFHFDFDD